MAQVLTDLRHLDAIRIGDQERRRTARTGHHPTNRWNNNELDITNRYMDLLLGHDALSQHRIRSRQADTDSLVRSTRTRNRYLRAAYTLYEDQHPTRDTGPLGTTPSTPVPSRATFVHALARLTTDQRRAIQLRLLDGYPRDAAALAMGKSVAAVKSLEQRALRRLHTQLARPATARTRELVADRPGPRAAAALGR
jgi:Sigma-70, region 4